VSKIVPIGKHQKLALEIWGLPFASYLIEQIDPPVLAETPTLENTIVIDLSDFHRSICVDAFVFEVDFLALLENNLALNGQKLVIVIPPRPLKH
jgi:hypothetical protein